MIARLVPIGNSRGIRIPKAVLDQCQMTEAVEVSVKGRQIIVSPVAEQPRQGWREAAAKARAAGDDELLIPDSLADDADVEWS
ncbi:MAG: AbrB/MazE/SpoVT family DNA-binding domain-containing protein [Pirellulales bacterium]